MPIGAWLYTDWKSSSGSCGILTTRLEVATPIFCLLLGLHTQPAFANWRVHPPIRSDLVSPSPVQFLRIAVLEVFKNTLKFTRVAWLEQEPLESLDAPVAVFHLHWPADVDLHADQSSTGTVGCIVIDHDAHHVTVE